MGRDEDYENSCEYAATGNHQVKRSQVARRRFGTRQLTVTHHANGGESDAERIISEVSSRMLPNRLILMAKPKVRKKRGQKTGRRYQRSLSKVRMNVPR